MQRLLAQDLSVNVETHFRPEFSRPCRGQYVYSYRVHIQNGGKHHLRLLSKTWWITDSTGQVSRIAGKETIGLQPEIAPGEGHQYLSWCRLNAELGKTRGSYRLEDAQFGTDFQLEIPEFAFCAPAKLN